MRKQSTTGLNFTLTTTLGDIDFFGDVAGAVEPTAIYCSTPSMSKLSICVSNGIDLPTLIRIKEAAGRPKDREAIAELRVLLQETEQKQS